MALTPEEIINLLNALDAAAPSANKLRQELQSASTAVLETLKKSSELAAVADKVSVALDKELEKRNYIVKNLERENELAENKFKREKDALKQYELALDLNKTKIKQLEQELAYLDLNDDKYQIYKRIH